MEGLGIHGCGSAVFQRNVRLDPVGPFGIRSVRYCVCERRWSGSSGTFLPIGQSKQGPVEAAVSSPRRRSVGNRDWFSLLALLCAADGAGDACFGGGRDPALLTAFFGVVIGRERASRGFWISAMMGAVLTASFCLYRSGLSAIQGADVLLLLAFVACSYGYAEGGNLSKELGGWQVICWALALAFPIELAAFLGYVSAHGLWIRPPSIEAFAGLLYVTAISQYIGFYFYYKGLALGGVAKMSQMQLFLPFFAIVVSHFVLGEAIDAATIVGAILITGTVFGGRLWSGA